MPPMEFEQLVMAAYIVSQICVSDPAANVGGFHFYTFNEVERTERWRRATIARLEAA
jgi:hypothetical protein